MKSSFSPIPAIGAVAALLWVGVAPAQGQSSSAGSGFSGTVSFTATGSRGVESGGTGYGDVATRDTEVGVSQTVTPDVSLGVGYAVRRLACDWATVPLPSTLRSLAASMRYSQELDAHWTGSVTVAPGFYNSGSSFSSHGFGIGAAVIAIHKDGPTRSLALGLAYSSLARGRLRILPVLGSEWKPAEKWTVAVGFPATAVSYDVSKALQLSLGADGVFDTYYVAQDPLPGQTGRPGLARTKLEYSEARIGLSARYAIAPQLAVFGAVGVVLERRFDYHERHFALKSGAGAPGVRVGCSATL